MVLFVLGLIASYFIGSIPTAYLMGKFLKGIDIRQVGSRNPGATNVFRSVGKSAGIVTLIIDALKGFIPVYILLHFFTLNTTLASIIGLAAIMGHNWTVFLNFKGGKGVATTTGVFLALLPYPTLIAIAFFILGFSITRHVSVGSLLGTASLPFSTWFFTQSYFFTFLAFVCGLLIFYLHRKNIARLVEGQESKISLGGSNGK